ncbi:hypothetical protein EV127DRAFT_485290 [Xylaria flabelliformis]|nr:hypothetical protein EV127DRAFT_485290 [Xylaria flabelliformis]
MAMNEIDSSDRVRRIPLFMTILATRAAENDPITEGIAQGLGAPNAPAHKEPHAPGEAPVASDSALPGEYGVEGGSTNIPGEKGIGGVPVREELEHQGNSMV